MSFRVVISDEFSAAMQLEIPGPCNQLHGHTYTVKATFVTNNLNKYGISEDYHALQQMLKQVLKSLDHVYLNEHAWFKDCPPSSENIAFIVFQQLKPLCSLNLENVSVQESKNCVVSYGE